MEIFNDIVRKKSLPYIADSAGLCAYGTPISDNSKEALNLMGINSDYTSKCVDEFLIKNSYLVFGLTNSHTQALKRTFPDYADKICSFPVQISDPYSMSLDCYIDCRDQIYDGLSKVFEMLENLPSVEFATDDDSIQISDIELQNFSAPWSVDAIKQFLSFDCNKILCVKINSKVVSYISFTLIVDEIQICNIATHCNFKNQGFASKLLKNLLKFAKDNGVSTIYLEVRKSNSIAINLYQKFNFDIVGTRKNFYANPTEDAYVFSYQVPQNEGIQE